MRGADTQNDARVSYLMELASLALERTRASHGDFRLVEAGPMNTRRALLAASVNRPVNLIVPTNFIAGEQARLAPIRFPVHLGLNGYRIALANEAGRQQLRDVRTVSDLARLRHVQGVGWADVVIMRANGFQVTEVVSYESIFQMLSRGRADVCFRSVLEVGGELQNYGLLPGLSLDDRVMLQYELPHFFFTNPANTVLIERLGAGLRRAFADGSLQALLKRRLRGSLDTLGLKQRRLLKLASPPGWPPPDPAYHVDLQKML